MKARWEAKRCDWGGGDFVGVMGGDLLRSESILYRVYDRGRGFKLGMTICVELDGYAK